MVSWWPDGGRLAKISSLGRVVPQRACATRYPEVTDYYNNNQRVGSTVTFIAYSPHCSVPHQLAIAAFHTSLLVGSNVDIPVGIPGRQRHEGHLESTIHKPLITPLQHHIH